MGLITWCVEMKDGWVTSQRRQEFLFSSDGCVQQRVECLDFSEFETERGMLARELGRQLVDPCDGGGGGFGWCGGGGHVNHAMSSHFEDVSLDATSVLACRNANATPEQSLCPDPPSMEVYFVLFVMIMS